MNDDTKDGLFAVGLAVLYFAGNAVILAMIAGVL